MLGFQRRDFPKAVALSVNFAPIIKIQPAGYIALPMATVTFTAAAIANPAISKIQWEVNNGTGWQSLMGQTAATLRLTATAALSAVPRGVHQQRWHRPQQCRDADREFGPDRHGRTAE
jgi:hypothetical protein